MITLNEKDINIPELHKLCGFIVEQNTRFNYRIYGLAQENNPAILIEYHKGAIASPVMFQPVLGFLNGNGISTKVASADKGKSHIYIGIRQDLRKGKMDLAAKILKTIILHCENKLSNFDPQTKIKVKPFPENKTVVPKPAKTEKSEKLPEWLVSFEPTEHESEDGY